MTLYYINLTIYLVLPSIELEHRDVYRCPKFGDLAFFSFYIYI